jgi:S1-C subfamily serine protease
VAQRSGVDTSMIFADQAPALLWKDVLDAAARDGLTRTLVTDVVGALKPTSPARPFLADLLAGTPTPVSGEARGADGEPRFLHADDEVTEPESLLYQDDLTVEIGRLPALVAALQRLVALAPAVCKLTVDVAGSGQYGTAFRVGDDLLLTNWHVVHRRADGTPATAVTAEFGFEDDGRGGVLAGVPVRCDAAGIVSDEADDWAIVHAAEPLRPEWPTVALGDAAEPKLGSPAFIVQHPLGARKRVGIVRNTVSFVDDRIVHYLTDTQDGSSGAPVFDAEGRLIALHHAGGRPQEVIGKPPLRKNEGIRAARIAAALRERGVAVP